MIVLDTSVAVAFMNRRDDGHKLVAAWIDVVEEDLFTTPLIVAEIGRLVSRSGGSDAALAFYEDLASGSHIVECWPEAMTEAVSAARKYGDLGLADASLLALAA